MSSFKEFDPAEISRRVELRKQAIRLQIERLQEDRRILEDALNDDEGITQVVLEVLREDVRRTSNVRRGAKGSRP